MSKTEGLEYRVFCAARDGMAITVYAMLCNKTPKESASILSHLTEEEGQGTTPFIIAARNGHDKVVKMLLTHFKVDIEQIGTVKFDGYVIEGATALWCSAGGGHYHTVKTLISCKADVNHATLSNSTPLRAACFDGRLDIVKFLISKKANIHIPNKYNNTCLMIACYKGHWDVVQFLLNQGANPDTIANCGATALHFSSERGHLEIVKELVYAKAAIIKNDQRMTPLHIAAECGNADIVEFFISLPQCTKSERIEALELLGASYANDRDNYDIDKCYHYLWLAMQERHNDPSGNVLQKKVRPPVLAYENRQESLTVGELEAIKNDHNALHMEALIIRERILREDNVEIPHPIIFRGAVFADTARFDRCTTLWMRALMLRQKNDRCITKDLLRFAQVFSQMFHVGVAVEFWLAEEVFEFCLKALEKYLRHQKSVVNEDEVELAREHQDLNMHTALYLLAILTKVKCSKDEEFRLCRMVYRFVQLGLVLHSKPGYTPLHMICDEGTLIDDFHVSDVVHFPSDVLVKLLLQCGADPNQVDANANTPLHVIVKYHKPISDFLTLHNIIILLLEADTHADMVNNDGEIAAEAATTGVAEIILRTRNKMSLKCLSARVVNKYHIPYDGHVPHTLNDFIAMH